MTNSEHELEFTFAKNHALTRSHLKLVIKLIFTPKHFATKNYIAKRSETLISWAGGLSITLYVHKPGGNVVLEQLLKGASVHSKYVEFSLTVLCP